MTSPLGWPKQSRIPCCNSHTFHKSRWDDGSVLAEFRRDPDARKPNTLRMNREQANPLDRRVPLAVAILLNQRA